MGIIILQHHDLIVQLSARETFVYDSCAFLAAPTVHCNFERIMLEVPFFEGELKHGMCHPKRPKAHSPARYYCTFLPRIRLTPIHAPRAAAQKPALCAAKLLTSG